jgi:hypothetical protein
MAEEALSLRKRQRTAAAQDAGRFGSASIVSISPYCADVLRLVEDDTAAVRVVYRLAIGVGFS